MENLNCNARVVNYAHLSNNSCLELTIFYTTHEPYTKLADYLKLKGLTRLIKLVGLGLTYIVLYSCIDTIQTRHTT
jgi:hypothetical protein